MSANQKILDGIKLSIAENRKVTIDLREASTLTGSGLNAGGRTYFDDAFAALRYSNPFRMGSRNIKTPNSSAVQFVAKTGNATGANPWNPNATPNTGSPDVATSFWVMPTRIINAQLPVRIAALDDINGLSETLVTDLALEFSQQEGASMATNNDQAGSTTTTTGGTYGLRGLDTYISGAAPAYGSSGTAITNGIHTLHTTSLAGATVTYNKIVNIADSLDPQYWSLPTTAWHMTPHMIQTLRQLKDSQGLPLFLELGEPGEGGAVGSIFGWPVIPNSYLSVDFPIYLANWDRFLTIADIEEISIQMFEQTTPGFTVMYAEKRVASTVRDPYAGVRASAA
ncbi:major_cap_HK97, phage major capsid protein, HK97 family [uncultured Caudovirales phage]|uniref:Major_cap_HK97, phage major capsid protein, HK97 family n=1 Tax=uncultured Caudovirales phage TaxID=2100421 RepID=A0A6J5SUN2_9CAUD|nr:major_cap_HK97, phage major capsid protein, HK97 family [uncultured Caudovirales phage]CAB4219238.1 major_cap_HK97, phage major capsid protein, HK97 family [uncultured Caudovirales phage]